MVVVQSYPDTEHDMDDFHASEWYTHLQLHMAVTEFFKWLRA